MRTPPELPRRTYGAMPKESEEFIQAFSENLAETHKANTEIYISKSNTHRLRHGRHWNTTPHTSGEDSTFQTISSEFKLKLTDVANNNIRLLRAALSETAKEMHKAFAENIYKVVGAAAESVGNSVSAKDHASLTDVIYAAMEKIEFTADRFGNVTPPTMHVSPETGRMLQEIQSKADPEATARFEALVAAKTQAAINSELARKAKFVDYGKSDETSSSDWL